MSHEPVSCEAQDEPVSREGVHLSWGRIAFNPFQMDGRSAP